MMTDKDREWLEDIQAWQRSGDRDPPHIGPPLLDRLVDALLEQDREIRYLSAIEAAARAMLEAVTNEVPLRVAMDAYEREVIEPHARHLYETVLRKWDPASMPWEALDRRIHAGIIERARRERGQG